MRRWLVLRYVLTPLLGLGLLVAWSHYARAQKAEVAPGVLVTKKSYNAPVNEQPFFGFVVKEQYMLDADRKFIEAAIKANPNREQGAAGLLSNGWYGFKNGDFVTAGRRFNQAYLIAPGESGIYFAFAALVEARFKDLEYAEELFRVARTRPNPSKELNAQHGRLLVQLKRPKDAQPLLEQAVIDDPNFIMGWVFLADARLLNGDNEGACAAVSRGEALKDTESYKARMSRVWREAGCKPR